MIFIEVFRNVFLLGYFIIIVYAAFYLPSFLLFSILKINRKTSDRVVVHSIVGLVLFILAYYVLSWLHLQATMIFIVLVADLYVVKRFGFGLYKIEKTHGKSLSVVLAMSLLISLGMLTIGIYGNTILTTGEHLLHIAYIKEMIVHFPPDNPGFSGVQLKGYHFLIDFIISALSKTFFIPVEDLYYHLIPLFTAIMWGLSVYFFMYAWVKKRSAGVWAVFLTFFGSSFGFILYLQGHTSVSLDSVFGISQPIYNFANPHFALSIPLCMVILLLMHEYYKSKKYNILLPIALCIGISPFLKIYGGIILYAGFSFLILTDLIKLRFISIFYFSISIILSLLTFGLFVGGGQGLILYPLWPSHTVLIDNLPWYRFGEKQYTYYRLGVIRKIIEIESYGLMLYFIGNIGTRFVGILLAIAFNIKRKLPSFIFLTILIMTIVSIGIPLFFIQRGKVFETIQFAWYYPIFCSLFAAVGLAHFFDLKFPKILKIVLILIFVVFSLPSFYEFTKTKAISGFFQRESLSNPFYSTMKYLSQTGSYDDTVLEFPSKDIGSDNKSLTDWYMRSSSSITALGNKRTYANYETISYDNVDPAPRLSFLSSLMKVESSVVVTQEVSTQIRRDLNKRGIRYMYSDYLLTKYRQFGAKLVYKNKNNYIYAIQ